MFSKNIKIKKTPDDPRRLSSRPPQARPRVPVSPAAIRASTGLTVADDLTLLRLSDPLRW